MTTDSSILAWKILCTEEAGELQSMGYKESNMTEHACIEFNMKKTSQFKREAEDLNRHFSKQDSQMANKHIKRIFNTANSYRNEDQNHSEMSLCTCENGYDKKLHN